MAGSTVPKTRPNKKHKSTKSSQTLKEKQSTSTRLKNKATSKNEDPIPFGSDSDSDLDTDVKSLLDAYTKPQLIDFLLDAAVSDPKLQTQIRSIADSGTTFRKIFVYGLNWDTTEVCLEAAFSKFGEIEDCTVVLDKQTNRAKGFGFVLFKTRSAASKALKEPQKMVNNRYVSCQLACLGKSESSGNNVATGGSNIASYDYGRKIYVAPVEGEVKPDKLKEFFEKFGEIETGPIGFDLATGKPKGYAMFVYKDKEGANNALREPYKMFEGIQMHCKLANPPRPSEAVQQPAQSMGAPAMPVTPQSNVLAAAAAQNLALLAQSPMYAAILANPLLAAAALNPASTNYAALGGMLGYGASASAPGAGYGGVEALEARYGGGAAAAARVGYDGGGAGVSGLYGGVGLQGYQGGIPSTQGTQAGGTSRNAGGALGGYPPSFI